MLKLNECTKRFKKINAVDGFSMEFEKGVYGLLGPNGAGKTTLLRSICGIYNLNSGSIDGANDNIGYLPQHFGAFKQLKVFEMMEYFATLKKIPKDMQKSQIEFALEQVNLSDRIKSKVKTLSGGMLRRLGVAQAILGDPEIILFDEPTAGLDPEERTRFKNAVVNIRQGKTIVISTHIVPDVEAICNKIIVMNNGKPEMVGTPVEITKMAENKVYLVSTQDEDKLTGEFFIKDRVEVDGKSMVRVLSNEKQAGECVSPSLDDGYLCIIKNI